MSRLINCLSGFDPLVNIQISTTEQIGQIISIVRDKLIQKNNYFQKLWLIEVKLY